MSRLTIDTFSPLPFSQTPERLGQERELLHEASETELPVEDDNESHVYHSSSTSSNDDYGEFIDFEEPRTTSKENPAETDFSGIIAQV